MDSPTFGNSTVPRSLGPRRGSLLLSRRATTWRRVFGWLGHAILFLITCSSALAVLFIFVFIARDALPFFIGQGVPTAERLRDFFTGVRWDPSASPANFGVLPIFVGSGLVTAGATLVAVPLGVAAAVCLSDILPFSLRQIVKPVIEVLAAIPSVAYGFFAFVIFAPILQERGGALLSVGWWLVATPIAALAVFVLSDIFAAALSEKRHGTLQVILGAIMGLGALALIALVGNHLWGLRINSGVNALNVSIILGIMALPTVVSVSEDALQAVGRDLREGAYALGATRAEMLVRVVIPAAGSGIAAAVILGVMRAVGETMVVWMAAGNASKIPEPWYDLLEPVRTLTATIAGEMGEADQITGSARYHVLWAMALALLVISFACNLISEWTMIRARKKLSH